MAGSALLRWAATLSPSCAGSPATKTRAFGPSPSRSSACRRLGRRGRGGEGDRRSVARGARAAATALGRIGAIEADAALEAALDDPEHFVRAKAAESLGAIDAIDALPRLLEIARTDRFKPARAAARAIAAIDPETLRPRREARGRPPPARGADLAAL
jgi:hypothetical protein